MNIQKSAEELFGGACYAFAVAWLNSDPVVRNNFIYLIYDVVQGLSNGFIDPDGFVNAPHKYANMCIGENIYKDVEKVKIKSLDELPSEGEWAVEFNHGCVKHFVVCTKGKVVFDPWEGSETVKYGKPTSYRKFIKYNK